MAFSTYDGFNSRLIEWRYRVLSRYFVGNTCLEMGSGDGKGTELLIKDFDHVTAVDTDAAALLRLPVGCRVVYSKFEELYLEDRYDTVVLAHVLEHVDNPLEVLHQARHHIAEGGRLLIDVPNAMSLHRQLGVQMGLLGAENELNDADRSIGHQRIYTLPSLCALVSSTGMRIEYTGGVFLKVLSNAQTEETFDNAQLRGLVTLGERYPELAAEIYVVARHR